MNLVKCYEQQQRLNSQIIIDSKISSSKVSARKYLMLNVKLSDLANETQCFKYWVDGNLNHVGSDIINKYLDCLGHILTIGLDKSYNNIVEVNVIPNDSCLSDQFLTLYVDVNDMMVSCSKDHYETLLEDFLSLGLSLGFTEQQIEDKFINDNIYCEAAL